MSQFQNEDIYSMSEKKHYEDLCLKSKLDNTIANEGNFTECINFQQPINIDGIVPINENICVRKNVTDKIYSKSIGYECLYEPNQLLLDPDQMNTFKNYPVLHENDRFCSKNHQIYNNWTRRHISLQNYTPKQPDFEYQKIPELKYEECVQYVNKEINVPFGCSCKF